MTRYLNDAQKAIELFLSEAESCARNSLGFPAMLTTFSVMWAVAEALNPNDISAGIEIFTSNMPWPIPTWLKLPRGVRFSVPDAAKVIIQTRHSLAHQISLPEDVVLADNLAEADSFYKNRPNIYVFITVNFVSAVKQAAEQVVISSGNMVLDPKAFQHTLDPRDVAKVLATSNTSHVSTFDGMI